jgi:serine/threonine protein kinase
MSTPTTEHFIRHTISDFRGEGFAARLLRLELLKSAVLQPRVGIELIVRLMSRSASSTSPPPGLATHLIARSDIQYDESKLLGQGGYGAVFRGTRKGGARVAVKRLLQGLTESSKFAFQREVAIMSSMSCEFVVQIYGVVDDSPDQPVLLVMELMHQSLYQAYKSMPPPSLRQRIMWLIQAGKGIAFLHAGGVIHRDVKPSNMLISAPDKGQTLKMGDFGLSKSLSDITLASSRAAHAAAGLGTLNYMAPELLVLRPKYSPASDVFAFGVVVWELYCMKLPFADCKDMHLLMAEVRNGEREEFPPDMPAALRTMIERAWHQDPSQRPSIEQCVFDLEAMLVQDPSPDTAIAAPPPPTLHHSVPETHRPPADSGIPKHLAIEMPPPDSTPIDQQQVIGIDKPFCAFCFKICCDAAEVHDQGKYRRACNIPLLTCVKFTLERYIHPSLYCVCFRFAALVPHTPHTPPSSLPTASVESTCLMMTAALNDYPSCSVV